MAVTLPSTSGLQKGLKPSGMSACAPPPSAAAPAAAAAAEEDWEVRAADVLATTPVRCNGRTHLRERTADPFCSLLLDGSLVMDEDGWMDGGEYKWESRLMERGEILIFTGEALLQYTRVYIGIGE